MQNSNLSLREQISKFDTDRFLCDEEEFISLKGIIYQAFIPDVDLLRDKAVFIASARQLSTALALVELDGIASRVYLATPEISKNPETLIAASPDIILVDRDDQNDYRLPKVCLQSGSRPSNVKRDVATEWILFTSGTTGQPKMVVHTLESLAGVLSDGLNVSAGSVWTAFYDIRRYGGLQILLRALLGGGSMVFSSDPYDQYLIRCGKAGVTHISGTPSHWRKALMSAAIDQITPRYVRAGGEIVDQPLLDQLIRTFPHSEVAHAYASTEAGVGFDVRDGQSGFPASLVDDAPAPGKPEIRVKDGTLWIKSSRTASGYIGEEWKWLDGFIDTGDLVERCGDRFYFQGRREGVINVGGQKVYPEEVEARINAHPDVRGVRAWGRPNAMLGQVVAVDVVLRSDISLNDVRREILAFCHTGLEKWKVPVTLRQVDTIPVSPAGKILRS